jgi:hypothetical protein
LGGTNVPTRSVLIEKAYPRVSGTGSLRRIAV